MNEKNYHLSIWRIYSEGFDTIYHGDISERGNFDKYHQKKVDISVGGDKSSICFINRLSWKKITDISPICSLFFGNIYGKKNAFPLSQTTHPSHLDLCLGLPLLQSPAPFSTLPIYKNSYNLCPLRQLCHLLIYTKCIYIKSQHKRIFLRIN